MNRKMSMMFSCSITRMLLFLFCFLFGGKAAAETFEKNGVYYSKLSNYMVEVVAPTDGSKYTGDVTIPWFVLYNSDIYMVKGVGTSAFQAAQTLNSVSLPYGFYVLTIGDLAFNDCSLTSFMINETVTTIGEKAFFFCDKMKDLYMCAPDPATIEEIGSQAFSNINRGGNVCTLHVPTGSKALYEADTRFSNVFNVIEEFEAPVAYDVFVGGTRVTSENAADILGGGAASYTPATKTLTLNKDIKTPSTLIPNIWFMASDANAELNINVANDVHMDNPLGPTIQCEGGKTTISGSSKLSLSALYGYAIISDKDVVLDHANIEISSMNILYGDKESTLTIISSSIMGQGNGEQAAVRGWGSVKLEGCEIANPIGGRYDADSRALVDAEGNISRFVNVQQTGVKGSYDLKIAGIQVNSDNMCDITGDGAASYNPLTKTLTIKGDISSTGNAVVNNTGVEGLTILVAKDATLSSPDRTGINSNVGPVTLTGAAQLTLETPKALAMSVLGDMDINNLHVVLGNCKSGIYGTGTLSLNSASVEGTVTDASAFTNWILFSYSISDIVKPAGGKYDKDLRQLVDKEGNPSPTVVIKGKDNPILTFDKQMCMAKPGQPFTAPKLTAPNGIITYSSSNPDVAAVSGTGSVTIISEGVAVITASYNENVVYNSATAQYSIVSQKQPEPDYDVNRDGKVNVADVTLVVGAAMKEGSNQ